MLFLLGMSPFEFSTLSRSLRDELQDAYSEFIEGNKHYLVQNNVLSSLYYQRYEVTWRYDDNPGPDFESTPVNGIGHSGNDTTYSYSGAGTGKGFIPALKRGDRMALWLFTGVRTCTRLKRGYWLI